ncbi:MAG: hypothetical protein B7Y90_17890 [Alphaproteobacteria bacterium 32-64-14]|nr:MAG: hypothetical protein B7Y90_17890 [Alphaproteobacteria bacterium 32-64-14]
MSGAKRLLLAGAILAPTALLFLIGTANQPSRAEPGRILEIALTGYAKGDFDPFVGRPFGEPLVDLRGLSEADAKGLLSACADPSRWTYLGDEQTSTHDRGDFPNAIVQCQRENGSLVARLWTERQKVDHLIELAYRSEFVACKKGLCPNLAVGEPQDSDCFQCDPRFKIQKPVNSQ